jgi:tight adherence protein C
MQMIFFIMLGAVFAAVFLLILFFSMPAFQKNAPGSSIKKLTFFDIKGKKQQPNPTFVERIVLPVSRKFLSIFRKVLPRNLVESVSRRLELAGIGDNVKVDVFLGIKFFMPFVFLLVLFFISIFFNVPTTLKMILLLLVPVSYIFPDYYLKSKTKKRQEGIRKSLPNALDLLTISVEAGLGFDMALYKVAENIKGTLGEEFKRVIKEMEIGLSRKEALRNLTKRTDVTDLNTFILSIIQADIFGISIGKVLRVQAGEMRIKRSQAAEEKGMKAPVKLVFPTILFLLPALMIVVVGPAILRVMDLLKAMK